MSSVCGEAEPAILIGIGSCLLGEKVRFDGGHKQSRYISDTLRQYFHFKPSCAEMTIGLGIPRESIERSHYLQPHPDELMLLNSL